jgi:predicted ABC-type ATPase
MRNLIEQRKTFAFESTLSGRTPARWIDLAKREGFEFHLLFLRLESEELAIERVAERVRRGGHDVPEDVIRRRYRLGIRNFFEMYQPQADEWMMYDTSLSESDLIAAGRGNNVSTVYKRDKWQKICEELK